MYYELLTTKQKNEIKRDKIIDNKEEILRIAQKMLDKDSHLNYEYYDLYKDTFYAFSKDVIDKTNLLKSQHHVSFDIPESINIDKKIMLRPKPKTIIEMFKKI
jgi:hypothetical protein